VVILPLLCGAIDFAFILHGAMRGEQAYRAAAYYAWTVGTPLPTTANVVTAALNAVGNDPSIQVVPSFLYFCMGPVGGHGGVAGASAPPSCVSNQVLATYLRIAVTTTVTLPVTFTGLGTSYVIATAGMVRVQ
jgi:Flp pilus assembly protein TadG